MIYNKKFLKGTAKGQNDVFAIFIKVRIVCIGGFHVTSSPPCWWTENKRSLISSLCLSTSICSFHHCYLCLPRLLENHLYVVWSFGDQKYSCDGEPMVNILYGERDVRSQKRLVFSWLIVAWLISKKLFISPEFRINSCMLNYFSS